MATMIFLFLVTVFTLFPIVYMLLGSFKTSAEILTGDVFLPHGFSLENYRIAWNEANFSRYTLNSVFMAVSIVIGCIATATTAGYVFSRGNFPGKKILFGLLLSTMFISLGSLSIFPQYKVAKIMGLHHSLWGVIVIYIFGMNTTQFFLSRGYVDSIPRELDEAAKIDGCGFSRTFALIIFPNLKPLVATVGLLAFRLSWNDYLLSYVFTLAKPERMPLIVGVINLKNLDAAASSWNLILAGAGMAIVPIVVAYLVLNRYFITNLTAGAIKA
jgi:ABC-type glycerol-3-phosphate transport system permease component